MLCVEVLIAVEPPRKVAPVQRVQRDVPYGVALPRMVLPVQKLYLDASHRVVRYLHELQCAELLVVMS
ncbi:Uncharacterised protein [Chlamydia trachomatis]|nr:Uncharacterised protein [Chlamydia trachomatis]